LIADALREYLQAPAQFGVKLLCFTLSIDNPQPRIRKLATIGRSAASPMRNKSNSVTVVEMTGALMIAALTGGCVSSQAVVIGHARPAISAEQVQIYLEPPESKYDEIANLSASSRGSFSITAAAKMDKVVARLKIEAAKLGANGILLHGVGDQAGGSVGAGISTETNSPHSPYGLGFGASAFFFQKTGDGVAIFVEPK
jgi:hypothetical protein